MAFVPRRAVIALAFAGGLAAGVVHCSDPQQGPVGPDGGADGPYDKDGNPCGALSLCGSACVDVATSVTDCGGCGKACAKGESCVAGACKGCASVDADGDGDDSCKDCDDSDPLVNHAAFDVPGNGKDDDCNGTKDDVIACEGTPQSNSAFAIEYARAMEVCEPALVKTDLVSPDDRSRQIAADWGIFKPQAGARFAAFSTGVAAALGHTSPAPIPGQTPQLGTDFQKKGLAYPGTAGTQSCPLPLADPVTVNDLTSFSVTILVPSNAHSFLLDLNFLTADAPEWPCSDYDDQALVLLDSGSFKGNVILDAKGRRMGVNHGLVLVKDAPSLLGTGYDVIDGNGKVTGAATGWVTVSAPVTPREQITLRFYLFDAKDGIYDSQLLLDHFRWSTDVVTCPTTTSPLDDAGAGGCPSSLDAGKD